MKRSRFIFSMSKVSEAAEADTTVDTSVGDAAVDTPTVEAKTPAAGSAKARKRPNKRKAEDSPAKAPPAKAAKNDEATPKRKSGRPVAEKKPKVKESPVPFICLAYRGSCSSRSTRHAVTRLADDYSYE